METDPLSTCLNGLPLGKWRYFDSVGSTNDLALQWIETGAPDLGLFVADQQTQGRGRLGRRWVTNPGAALAFSLVIRPSAREVSQLWAFSALGALSVQQALRQACRLDAQIKWPNDILLKRRKVSGILVEASWLGSNLEALVIGIGINISQAAVPLAEDLLFPATSIEAELNRAVNRWEILRAVIQSLLEWRPLLGSESFRQAWEDNLAFRGEWVTLSGGSGPSISGQLQGIGANGHLQLRDQEGHVLLAEVGDLHLRSTGRPS
jgi:BirA family transcriptional regulator, biotin operon repressor / biotin---[acetyl-CoA-carboxylase] ligase